MLLVLCREFPCSLLLMNNSVWLYSEAGQTRGYMHTEEKGWADCKQASKHHEGGGRNRLKEKWGIRLHGRQECFRGVCKGDGWAMVGRQPRPGVGRSLPVETKNQTVEQAGQPEQQADSRAGG